MAAQITATQCRPLATAPGFALRADAATAWDRAVTAFGSTVLLTGAWRSYATQERLFRERYTRGYLVGRAGYTSDARYWLGSWWTRKTGTAAAAVPGTSNHGGGLAVDVKTRRDPGDPPHPAAVVFTGFDDADRLRFLKTAQPYGWADDEGRSVAEPWHLTYNPARDKHPTTTSAPPKKGHRDMIELIRTLYRRYLDRIPTTAEELAWSDAFAIRDLNAAAAHAHFRTSPAEGGTIVAAYRAHLGRDATTDEIKTWSQGLTIDQVWTGIGGSSEAAARR